jgi:hypothetical protein
MTACKCFWYTSRRTGGCEGRHICSCDWGWADSEALSWFWTICGYVQGYQHIQDKPWVDCAACY